MTSPSKLLDFQYTEYFIDHLDQGDAIQVEYVWLGGNSGDLRCKTKTVYGTIKGPSDLPVWNYDGSSTNQADGHDSEVLLRPVRIFRDPFRRGKNLLVLCDTFNAKNGLPLATNSRYPAEKIFNQRLDEEPWYGIEQEYTLFTTDGHPLGWPKGGYPGPQGPYYCSAGADVSHGRAIVEAHYRCCLYAGIKIAGINAEVMPGQWEFQVGPCQGIEAGDHLWMARYIMHRLGEMYNIVISFDPKPIRGDWNGAGAHTNYSTKSMRAPGGYKAIQEAIEKLSKRHKEHIEAYGEGNDRRLTGHHETASFAKFSAGVADRGASCRVPRDTEKNGCGYFEDRRPAANMDPYVVTSLIFNTTVLWDGK